MYIVEVTYQKTLDAIDAQLEAHHQFLQPYYDRGIFLASGPQNPRQGGIIIASGKIGKTELEALFKEDPFYVQGLAHYHVTEFHPVMARPELQALL
ncbi:MAG: YciI family protein [Zoogloeaceae bacterium]|jgi:uncharacterized protein YciI|nr:YciI family protein [Zoogloeaceae bacterium]